MDCVLPIMFFGGLIVIIAKVTHAIYVEIKPVSNRRLAELIRIGTFQCEAIHGGKYELQGYIQDKIKRKGYITIEDYNKFIGDYRHTVKTTSKVEAGLKNYENIKEAVETYRKENRGGLPG